LLKVARRKKSGKDRVKGTKRFQGKIGAKERKRNGLSWEVFSEKIAEKKGKRVFELSTQTCR